MFIYLAYVVNAFHRGGVETSPLQHLKLHQNHKMGTTAPFGQWQSPISSTLLGADGVQFESIAVSAMIGAASIR